MRFKCAAWLLITLLFSSSGISQTPSSSEHKQPKIRVILLGTGAGPAVNPDRYGAATLVIAGNESLLFDCGRGTMFRLFQSKISPGTVTKVFLTHLHSDHIIDLPDLYLTGWGARASRSVPLQVWGPAGTASMMSHLEKAFEFDIHMRRDVEEGFPPNGIKFRATDLRQGVVFDRNGVKVTAFLVDHGPVKPAFGYRVDYAGASVALSGDTRPSENLVRFSQKVDVLIHEVFDGEAFRSQVTSLSDAQKDAIIAHHTTPEQAASIFSKVKPRLAVYSHFFGTEVLLQKTRTKYSGPLELGQDLMVVDIGDTVEVSRPGLR